MGDKMDAKLIEQVAKAIAQADEQNGALPYEVRIQGKYAKESLYGEAKAAIAAVSKYLGEIK